jgi:uncharacterized 2Fe-2S/4Fe-4S cluster protein (DUF4445 family)
MTPNENGEKRYYIRRDVYISDADVRQLQLAKAAIRAGIETLIDTAGLRAESVGSVLIAGGFGAYINVKNACAVGLLPPKFLHLVRHTGNSAGAGAALALLPENRQRLGELRGRLSYLELSVSGLFAEKYVDSMIFNEAMGAFSEP